MYMYIYMYIYIYIYIYMNQDINQYMYTYKQIKKILIYIICSHNVQHIYLHVRNRDVEVLSGVCVLYI